MSASSAVAQYNSGSSGVHGVFPPAPAPANARYLLWDLKTGLIRYCSVYDTTARPDTCTTEISTGQIPGIPAGGLTTGVFEFSSVDVSRASTGENLEIWPVGYDGPTPLTILVQTTFRLRTGVSLQVRGGPGAETQSGLPPTGFGAPGGRPGPGGFAGGNGGKMGSPSLPGNAGFGPNGGAGGSANSSGPGSAGANASPSTIATSLVPLIGGSGGGGQGAFDTACGFRGAGGGGGGGGGAVLIAASGQIILEGNGINAQGGNGGNGCNSQFGGRGGTGGGGSVRLVSPTIGGVGNVSVGNGIVRFEGNASTYSGLVDAVRGTVLAAPQPVVVSNAPALRIVSVGGIAVGSNPSGTSATPDVTFSTAPSGPVPVDITASNIPTGTTVNLRANPVIGTATTATSSALAGSLQNSTASASLQIPAGAGVITAVTSFPVTVAMLDRLPSIPGLTPTTVEVTADADGTSRIYLLGAGDGRVQIALGSDGRYEVVQ